MPVAEQGVEKEMFHRSITRCSDRKFKSKGQAVVETALLGLILAMLLAAAIDFGRAYYTAVVVTNMAGEGAAYASIYPSRDSGGGGCTSVGADKDIRDRIINIAIDRGLVINSEDRAEARGNIVITANGSTSCASRCDGENITVKVTYNLDDLFLPGLIGFTDIPITKEASQLITSADICP